VVVVPGLEAVAEVPQASRAVVLLRTRPDAAARRSVLREATARAGLHPSARGLQQLATGFDLTLVDLDAALRMAAALGADAHTVPEETDRLLAQACRCVVCPSLPRFAHRLQACVDLEDVVLPEAQQRQLREIVAQVRNAPQVLEEWGFGRQLSYGRGIAAVFSGPSGTGKTMAARGIAGALGTDAFVVDLSQVVSKYIGETEKHLDAVFNDAQRCAAVLVFDEADALFGRRSEVKDAHDRYANIEVAYLLQRLESFTGLAILTTNLQQNVDPAFLRRLRFVVEFPRPDAAAREDIWRRCLPDGAPVDGTLDLLYLAERFELSGGRIRQFTLRAAFLAAQQSAPGIAMRHLVDATLTELRKLGLESALRELAAYRAALRPSAQQDSSRA
jgi:AAA+ superfamily predicted ATPase